MASMHLKSNDFIDKRRNSLSISGWNQLIKSCSESIPTSTLNKIEPNILEEIQHSFNFCKKYWPKALPQGLYMQTCFQIMFFFMIIRFLVL